MARKRAARAVRQEPRRSGRTAEESLRDPEPSGTDLSRTSYRIHLVAATALLFFLAAHRAATFGSEPGGRFEDPDAAFHAHRVAAAIAQGTLLPPTRDAFEDFPAGSVTAWPPLYDAGLGLIARAFSSTSQEPRRGFFLMGAVPPFLLVGGALMAAALARRFSTTYAGGAVAAWLVATTPALLRRGAWGEIDHNAVEVAGALALLSLAVGLMAWKAPAAGTSARHELVAALAFASATLFGMGLFGGLTLAAVVVAGAVSVATVFEGRSRAGTFAFALLLAAAALPLFYRLRPPLAEGDPWRIGPVYVLVLALFAAALGGLATANALRLDERGRDLLLGGLALAGGTSFLLFSSPANREGLVRGLGFLGSRDPWLSTIDEFQPAWVSPETLRASLPALAAGLVFAVVVLYRKRRDLLPVLLPFAAFCALALLQRRYVPVATAFCAVLAGAAWPLVPRALARTGLAVAILAVLSPLAEMAAATLRNDPAPNVSPSEVAADALVALTPLPDLPPAWGVLAPWDYGHHILARGGRAVALNNFGSFHPGFAEKTALWLEESPAAAVSRLSALKLRYVLAVYPPNVLPGAAVSLGRDAKAYLPDGLSAGRPARYEPTELARKTFLVRLHLEGGAPREGDTPGDLAALARLRMVWESDFGAPGPGGRELPFMRLFEVRSAAGAEPHATVLSTGSP